MSGDSNKKKMSKEQLLAEMERSLEEQKKIIDETEPKNMLDRLKLAQMHKVYIDTCAALYKLAGMDKEEDITSEKRKKIIDRLIAKEEDEIERQLRDNP